MAKVVIPLSTGFRQDTDPKVLPQGALRTVRNLRLRRNGQLAARFGFDALPLTSHASDIIAADLIAHNSKLHALASTDGETSPTDLVEFVNATGQAWKHSFADSLNAADNGKRLNSVERVRNLARPQVQTATNSVDFADVGAVGGVVMLVSNSFGSVHVQVIRADTDSLLVTRIVSGTQPRVVVAGGKLFCVYTSGNLVTKGTILRAMVYDASAGNSVSLLTDISSTTPALDSFDVFQRTDPDDGFNVVESRGTTVTIRQMDANGAELQNYSFTGPALSVVSGVETDNPDERVTIATKDQGSTSVQLRTFLASSGALQTGPTEIGDPTLLPADQQVGLTKFDQNTAAVFTRRTVSGNPNVHCSFRSTFTHNAAGGANDDRLLGGVHLGTRPARIEGSTGILLGGVWLDEGQGTANNILHEWYPADLPSAVPDRDVAHLSSPLHLSTISRDPSTGKYYWVRQLADTDGSTVAVVAEFDAGKSQRRQMLAVNGDIYLTGGALQLFDGRLLLEAGFLSAPVIVSAVPGGLTGLLTVSSQYTLVAVAEWFDTKGRKHESPPSQAVTVELSATDSAIDLVVRPPLTMRRNGTNDAGLHCNIVIYRTLPAPDTTLHRDVIFFPTAADSGQTLSFSCTQADDTLAAQGIVYTQAATGVRSGPAPFVAPLPASYGWASADKVLTSGLPSPEQIQESRSAFPNEPVSWSATLGGIRGIRADVLAVASVDERRIVFTADEIFQVDGEGVDINGVGDLGAPRKLPSACGLAGGRDGWRSIVESDAGLFFLGSTGLLYMLPRGGGAPVDIGAPVQDTLEAFPVVAAAVHNPGDQTVSFACNTADNSAGTLLVYDILEQQWTQDDEPGAVRSLAVLDQRLVVLGEDGTIRRQRTAHPAESAFTMEIVSGTVHPFSAGVEGQIDLVQLVGEYRADCVVNMYLSNDDGQTEEELGEAALVGRKVGSTFTLSRQPEISNGNRFRLRITCDGDEGPTEGVRFTYAVLHCTSAKIPMLTNDEDNA